MEDQCIPVMAFRIGQQCNILTYIKVGLSSSFSSVTSVKSTHLFSHIYACTMKYEQNVGGTC
jgi:hypothetical protein